MSELEPAGRGPLFKLGVALGCVLLFAVFFAALFPYERLRGPLERTAGSALGGEVRIGRLAGHLTWAGPGVRLAEVRVRPRGRAAWQLDALDVRPAFSLSWLRGVPALHVRGEAWGARVDGTTYAHPAEPGFDGRVDDLDPSVLPPGLLPTEAPWIGALDADVDLRGGPDGARGTLAFESDDGALTLPGVPFALPYDRVEGALDLGEEWMTVESLDLEGPMLSASATGRVGAGDPSRARLELEVDVRRAEPNVQRLLENVGVPLRGADGSGRLRIEGSVSRPVVTPL